MVEPPIEEHVICRRTVTVVREAAGKGRAGGCSFAAGRHLSQAASASRIGSSSPGPVEGESR
jgi:hypothetical protein